MNESNDENAVVDANPAMRSKQVGHGLKMAAIAAALAILSLLTIIFLAPVRVFVADNALSFSYWMITSSGPPPARICLKIGSCLLSTTYWLASCELSIGSFDEEKAKETQLKAKRLIRGIDEYLEE